MDLILCGWPLFMFLGFIFWDEYRCKHQNDYKKISEGMTEKEALPKISRAAKADAKTIGNGVKMYVCDKTTRIYTQCGTVVAVQHIKE